MHRKSLGQGYGDIFGKNSPNKGTSEAVKWLPSQKKKKEEKKSKKYADRIPSVLKSSAN